MFDSLTGHHGSHTTCCVWCEPEQNIHMDVSYGDDPGVGVGVTHSVYGFPGFRLAKILEYWPASNECPPADYDSDALAWLIRWQCLDT